MEMEENMDILVIRKKSWSSLSEILDVLGHFEIRIILITRKVMDTLNNNTIMNILVLIEIGDILGI
jgi:hypothetical protein